MPSLEPETSRVREIRDSSLSNHGSPYQKAVGIGWYVYASATAGKPDFMIAASIGVTIHAGAPTITTINVRSVKQFSATILLTAQGSPGLTATISPFSVTGSGTATLTTASP